MTTEMWISSVASEIVSGLGLIEDLPCKNFRQIMSLIEDSKNKTIELLNELEGETK